MVILCREHIKTEVLLLIYLIMLSYLRLGRTSGGHLSCFEEGNSWIRLLSVYSSWVVDITKDKNSPPTWPISGVSPPVWWGGKKTTLQISNQNFLCSNSHPVPLVLSTFLPGKSWLHFLYIFPISSWRWQLNFLLPFSGWKKKVLSFSFISHMLQVPWPSGLSPAYQCLVLKLTTWQLYSRCPLTSVRGVNFFLCTRADCTR